ncbi:unnamed protein product [Diatraea saccharalis]|uniref:Transmembrane protein 234 n=1 Tax=Diatraea saccharalis TaxID=40085 RepID=A0A9N9WI30_9NEOP|nr:unnamed protein product [Diatraea saccharalis]
MRGSLTTNPPHPSCGLLVLTGALWGCTNPFIRQGTKGLRDVHAKTWLGQAWAEVSFLLGNWRYVLPWLVNQSGSLAYLAAVQRAPLSVAVPTANSLAFAFTAVVGAVIGAEEPLNRADAAVGSEPGHLSEFEFEYLQNRRAEQKDDNKLPIRDWVLMGSEPPSHQRRKEAVNPSLDTNTAGCEGYVRLLLTKHRLGLMVTCPEATNLQPERPPPLKGGGAQNFYNKFLIKIQLEKESTVIQTATTPSNENESEQCI